MWRIWLLFEPRRTFMAVILFLYFLAFFIHFVLLSTDRYNWFEGAPLDRGTPTAMEISPQAPSDHSLVARPNQLV